ncbi:Hsp20 family protein [Alphaproteobacteria bacterium]|jgi:molecular chaperone IbpA|nr:Hsp20 family protein [Alphaproteobacteria bacterium]
MTILPTLALRSFVGFDNLFNELETISTQKQNSFPAHDILRISEDEYEITLALSGFNKDDISIDVHDGVLTIRGNGGTEVQNDKLQYLYKGIAKRSFEQKFRLEQYVDVKDAKLSNGLLTISLLREIPEERKPRQITLKSA